MASFHAANATYMVLSKPWLSGNKVSTVQSIVQSKNEVIVSSSKSSTRWPFFSASRGFCGIGLTKSVGERSLNIGKAA